MEPQDPGPSRPRELNWFLALAIAGAVCAIGAGIFLYWVAPALFSQ